VVAITVLIDKPPLYWYNRCLVVVQYEIRGRTASAIGASIERAIRRGRIGAGDTLPTVRALAGRVHVSPATVMAAYQALRRRGLLVAHGRGGTRVSGRPPLPTRAALPLPPDVHNFVDGNPDPALLPSLERALAAVDPRPRLYTERGADPALLALATRHLAGDGLPHEALCVVGGALDGIERALQAHLRPGDRVALEDPGYHAVVDLAHAIGLTIEPMRIDEHGPLPEELDRVLRRPVQAVIVTPRAQNPTGAALDPARVTELRRVLARHPEALVIEDDHAGPVAGARSYTLCDPGRQRFAIVRSVSKSLGPDLRVAVMSGDPTTVARVEGRQLIGAGWVSRVLQSLVINLWNDAGTARLLQRAEAAYTRRREGLLRALAAHGIAATGRSGMNVWIPVPEEVTAVRHLLDAGFAVSAGERFRLATPPAIRVTTAAIEPAEATVLAAALAEILAPSRRTRSA
jgi:DNA-binding transcriptional MocR family regulator